LRDEIDPALTRRFQVTLHFPRPALPERRRLWALAFARGAAIDGAVDLDELAQLDLTGAAIMSASRLAGLLAAAEPSETIRLEHIGEAISRQFRQEARLLRGRAIGVLRLEHGAAS
jgi:ATP-dependent 26S proteasome regulatory subunit